MIPVVAANRYGTEVLLLQDHHDVATTWTERQRIHFYGRSFITDETGAVIKQAKDGADILVMEIDVRQNEQRRAAWGLFRDRRPDLYKVLLTKDGSVSSSTC
jgi:N-carbamoylputrescine amidase